MALRGFFRWISGQVGYRKISYTDADHFNSTANDGRIATATREKPAPSIEQIRYVLKSIKPASDLDRRDQALIAFALLTGARDDAMASLALRHVDIVSRTVFQDARSVRTKNRKTFTSWFFPIGDDIEAIVVEWVGWLKVDRVFGPDDPRSNLVGEFQAWPVRISRSSGWGRAKRRQSGLQSGQPACRD